MLNTGRWQEGSLSEISLLSAWFFCKAKTALKNEVRSLKKKDLTKGGCSVANSFFSRSALYYLPRDIFPYLRPWAPSAQAPCLSIPISSHSSARCPRARGPGSALSCLWAQDAITIPQSIYLAMTWDLSWPHCLCILWLGSDWPTRDPGYSKPWYSSLILSTNLVFILLYSLAQPNSN